MDLHNDTSGVDYIEYHNKTFTCIPAEDRDYGGFFSGVHPLGHSFPVFLVLVAFSGILAHVIHFILKPLRQPKFVCSLLAGILIGPTSLGRIESYTKMMFTVRETLLLDVTSNLGVIYFLFLTMVKMDTTLAVRASTSAWAIGCACLFLPLLIILALYGCTGKSLTSQLNGNMTFMTLFFTLSHFPNVAHALEELDLSSSDIGQLSLSASAVNEIIALTSVVIGMVIQTSNFITSIWLFLSVVLILFLNFFVVRQILFYIVRKTPAGKPVEEIYITGILLGAMVMSFLTDAVGLVLLGAILYGLAVPNGPPLASTLVDKSELFIMEFLMPLFYLFIGLNTNVYSIKDYKGSATFALVTLLVSFLKLIGGFLTAAMYYKIRFRHAFVLGLILNMRGVIEIITIRKWQDLKMIDDESYTLLVLANLVITAVIVPLIKVLYKPGDEISGAGFRAIQKSLHSAELRVISCIHDEDNVNSTITLLEACKPTPRCPIYVSVVHLVELAGRAAPVAVPYSRNKKELRSWSFDHILQVFDNYSKPMNGAVVIKPFTVIASYKSMHENICKLARDQAANLIIIPFQKRREGDAGELTHLHSLNTNLQAFAQCTVGILVDRGFPHYTRQIEFSYRMVVIFCGGPDDREALAFATRISGRPGIQITVIRIFLNPQSDDEDDNEGERKLDASVVEEYKMKNNQQVQETFRQMVAADVIEVVDMMKSLELDYDLVIVGHRPLNGSLFTKRMFHFSENPELGVIADVIMTDNFHTRSSSILVMQHYS